MGCRWPCCGGNTTLTVEGCNNGPLSGVSVAISTTSGGTPFFAGVTDASGQVSFTLSASGVYYITTSASVWPLTAYALGTASKYLAIGGNTLLLSAASGYVCCSGVSFPLPTTLYLSICSQLFTLTFSGSSWSNVPSAITTAGVADDGGACTWSGYPATTTGTTLVGFSLSCPTSATAMSGFVTTSALGHYNSVTGGYDAFALCPSSCSPTNSCLTTPLSLSGTVGQTISLSGTMPASVPSSCVSGLTPYALPCASQTVTVTN